MNTHFLVDTDNPVEDAVSVSENGTITIGGIPLTACGRDVLIDAIKLLLKNFGGIALEDKDLK